MILADKIIKERKKLGMSQEELAEKMNVSRQAVSKWEGNQSVPEIEKILQLSRLFGVTTDYLLKDEIENGDSAGKEEKHSGTVKETFSKESPTQDTPTIVAEKSGSFPFNHKTVSIGMVSENKGAQTLRNVTAEEAKAYIVQRKTASRNIAIGTFLCIISVVPMFMLCGINEFGVFSLSENAAGALGLILMLILVAAAVGLFVYTGFKNAPYEFLEKEPFETEHGVTDLVREQQKAFSGTYVKFNIIGAIICVLSPIALFIGAINEFTMLAALSIMLIIAGIGVVFFILAGVPHECMQKLLKEGDYSEEAKKSKGIKGTVAIVYWLVVTAVYLLILFLSKEQDENWKSGSSWVIWPVAAVLFPAVMSLCGIFEKKGKEK